jgi:hypothetical protein
MELVKNNKFELTFNPVSFSPASFSRDEWRDIIVGVEGRMKSFPNSIEGPEKADKVGHGLLKHAFVDGAYVRQIIMPKGILLTSQIHKYEHPYFIMKGECTVVTEEGEIRIKAPFWGITKPGTKRLLYIHEEVIWVTVHVTDKKDLKDIQKEIVSETFSEMDKFEKEKMLKLMEEKI